MPLYDYKCSKCGQVFEVRQSFSDALLTTHDGCGGALERLISAPALQFKGTGWYITDYARGGGSSGSKSDSRNESKGDPKGESKGESKPSSKSDSSSSSGSSTSSSSSGGSSDSSKS